MHNLFLTDSWWVFEHSSKIDQLQEPQHTHLIYKALGDRETQIERSEDGSYILYGDHEALLVFPKLLSTRLLLSIYRMVRQNQAAVV